MNRFNILIKNSTVVDGSGDPGFRADVGIVEDKISFIGRAEGYQAETVIDAEGMVLCPGFVDMHGHSDINVVMDSSVYNKVEQGITTEVAGMCGLTVAPISEKYFMQLIKYTGFLSNDEKLLRTWRNFTSFGTYLDTIEKLTLGVNMAFFVGHGTLRIAVMGFENRKANAGELSQMKAYVREAMGSGAFGLSTGLIYPPGVYTSTDELVELCKVVAEYGGSYVSHIRNESHGVVGAVQEAIDIGRQAGIPVIISHHKIAGKRNWGTSRETTRLINEAITEGLDVSLDQYPYKAGATALKAVIPPKYHEGGTEQLVELLKDKRVREEVITEIRGDNKEWDNLAGGCGPEGILVLNCEQVPKAQGKTIAEYAKDAGLEPWDAILDLIVRSEGAAGAAYFLMGDEDIERIMQYPHTMIGTDAGVVDPKYGNHPRATGTFPRILGRYVREKGILGLEEAICKMTSLPAKKAGLKKRGLVREGYYADLVLFNPETVIDRATYQEPLLKNEGIEYVFVNGKVAVKKNTCVKATMGRVIRLR